MGVRPGPRPRGSHDGLTTRKAGLDQLGPAHYNADWNAPVQIRTTPQSLNERAKASTRNRGVKVTLPTFKLPPAIDE